MLNLLCAVGSAIDADGTADHSGGDAARLGRISGLLGQTDARTIIEAAQRISPQTAAAIRALLDRIPCGSVRALIGDLETAGLIVPDVA